MPNDEFVTVSCLPRPVRRSRPLRVAMLALALLAAPEAGSAPLALGKAGSALSGQETAIVQVAETAPARLPRPRPAGSATVAANSDPGEPAPADAETASAGEAIEAGDSAAVAELLAPATVATPEAPPSGSGAGAAAVASGGAEHALLVPPPRPSPASDSPAEDADEAATAPAGDGNTAPLPRPRPDLTGAAAARHLAMQFFGFTPDFVLRSALDALKGKRYGDARSVAATHTNALVPALIDWLIARQPDSGLSAAKIIAILESHRGWPQPEQLQLRAEQAFHVDGPQGDAVLTFYNLVEPLTVGGRMALAGALRDAGRNEEAEAIVRTLWRDWSLAPGQAAALLTRFGAVLTKADHLYRFRRLVLRRRADDAAAQAKLLGPGYEGLARAVIAVLREDGDARKLLAGVAPDFLGDPLYVFARVHRLRRTGQPIEAARFLLGSQPDLDLSGDGDIWWEERQDLSRQLLDSGTPDLAYRVVADARAESEGKQVLAAFHAGWYALRFLDDSTTAEKHFRELHSLATLPRTQARASYWLGRTHKAEGRTLAARLDYVEAARFGGTFYGQLARQELGITTTGLERVPRPSALDRQRFANRDLVKIVRLLAAAGYADLSLPFLEDLGRSVDTPGEVALLSTLARRIGRPQAAIAAAAIAETRGLKVASLPALFYGVPAGLSTPEAVDRALVYAVVRQESAFNHAAVSHAGARGLMQLMPATARSTARAARIPYSEQRLVTDPLYNATLGAHHLGELLAGLKSSYLLTFVGYNAGPGRALQWVRDYGDPRGGATDPVDWIERIPFDETRDYVQKVMENLQLYRSRIGHPLSLSRDLLRGGPEG